MLVMSWRALDDSLDDDDLCFEVEYLWENFIIRLWLYRTTVKTLSKLPTVKEDADKALASFDVAFDHNGQNGLKAIRDMIEHFDDYAAGVGRGPAIRDRDLDPWRTITKDMYQRGGWLLDRAKSYEAAIQLRDDAQVVSDQFITSYKSRTLMAPPKLIVSWRSKTQKGRPPDT